MRRSGRAYLQGKDVWTGGGGAITVTFTVSGGGGGTGLISVQTGGLALSPLLMLSYPRSHAHLHAGSSTCDTRRHW